MNYIYQGSNNPYIPVKKHNNMISKNYGTFPDYINNLRDNNNNVNPIYTNIKNTNSDLDKFNINNSNYNDDNDNNKNSKNLISS